MALSTRMAMTSEATKALADYGSSTKRTPFDVEFVGPVGPGWRTPTRLHLAKANLGSSHFPRRMRASPPHRVPD